MENNKNNDKFIHSLVEKLNEIENDFIGDNTYVVGGVLENRFLFNKLIEIIKNNSKINKPNIFLDYIKINYISIIIVAICRQVDKHSDSVSLIKLLEEILNNAKKITKNWFISQYKTIGEIGEEIGKRDFEEHFGNLEYVDPANVSTDIERLIFDTKEIKIFRNKRIAHLDENKKIKFDVNFNVLNNSIDLIEKIIKKYYLLLNQSGMDELLPKNVLCFRDDGSNEEDIFCVPWKN